MYPPCVTIFYDVRFTPSHTALAATCNCQGHNPPAAPIAGSTLLSMIFHTPCIPIHILLHLPIHLLRRSSSTPIAREIARRKYLFFFDGPNLKGDLRRSRQFRLRSTLCQTLEGLVSQSCKLTRLVKRMEPCRPLSYPQKPPTSRYRKSDELW